MRILDLFAGVGGFSLAAHWMGWETVGFVEKDEACQRVLKKNFGDVPMISDVRDVTATTFDRPGIITFGFPCQDVSGANPNGKGLDGERSGLFAEGIRIVELYRPDWVIPENVANYSRLDIDRICEPLEDLGYETVTLDISAASVGLPTMERHIWIVAAAKRLRLERLGQEIPDGKLQRELQRGNQGVCERRDISRTRFCRVRERVSRKLDKAGRERLKQIGNSIPPQVAFQLFKAIEQAEI